MSVNSKDQELVDKLERELTFIISETNGIALKDTLDLLKRSPRLRKDSLLERLVLEFERLLASFYYNEIEIKTLIEHPVSKAFFNFFKEFPLPYHEEHIHLTGSMSADFIWPRLQKLLNGSNSSLYEKQIKGIYGKDAWPIENKEDVDRLIRLGEDEQFSTYLKILYLSKLVLVDKAAHEAAAYQMAKTLNEQYNVGMIRLKFSFSRATTDKTEQIPSVGNLSEEDVVRGLLAGFKKFKKECPHFTFILSPSFRKESHYFDSGRFKNRAEHFNYQVKTILQMIEKDKDIAQYLSEVDTVGDERELYRKKHFMELKPGFRKLQYNGIKIRSHHGETWKNLRKGIQSVDNAMNIWGIDTLEHGLSLGINPNYYFHRIYQRAIALNQESTPIVKTNPEHQDLHLELMDMEWQNNDIRNKLLAGETLSAEEELSFLKAKFHNAHELERYQHDVLNRMIDKRVSLVALPTSNMRLTGSFPDYKDHPFSWWEKKGVSLGVGTDNYITLSTNLIQEMLLLLYSDPENLKITKLLMIVTKETRRPYISHLLWNMRKQKLSN